MNWIQIRTNPINYNTNWAIIKKIRLPTNKTVTNKISLYLIDKALMPHSNKSLWNIQSGNLTFTEGVYAPIPCFLWNLYGRCRTLSTDQDNFLLSYLEFVYKTKYYIRCESGVGSHIERLYSMCSRPQYSYLTYILIWYRTPWTDQEIFF